MLFRVFLSNEEELGHILTCVPNLEPLLGGGVVGGPAEIELMAPAGEVGRLRVVATQDHQQGALS